MVPHPTQNVRGAATRAPPTIAGNVARSKPARLRIVVAEDEDVARNELASLLRHEGFDVIAAEDGAAGFACVKDTSPDVLVTDLRMPGMDGFELLRRAREIDPSLIVVLMTAFAQVDTASRAMSGGAEHCLPKPLQADELVRLVRRAVERRALKHEALAARGRLNDRIPFDAIVGSSPAMREVFDIVARVAPTKASVLISGESGTGKELVAQAIHEASPRALAPFVKLHCAALAETLLESELLVTNETLSPALRAAATVASIKPTVARCSSTRSAWSRPAFRSSSSASSKNDRSSASAATR